MLPYNLLMPCPFFSHVRDFYMKGTKRLLKKMPNMFDDVMLGCSFLTPRSRIGEKGKQRRSYIA